jgi:hypothetical protein
MNQREDAPAERWHPPARPEWLRCFLEDTQSWEPRAVAPLDGDELIATARRNTELDDFGEDDWREPFAILLKALEEEADLHLFGRLWARQELMLFLEMRLKIEATYRASPEIEDEFIDRPVFVTGMPRSGTSILFELLAQDRRFMAPANWEFVLPCPPPEAATYRSDPRVPRAHDLITQLSRVAPSFKAIHELGAWIPNECGWAMRMSFRSQHFLAYFQIPSYANWLASTDQKPAYAYYKRLLKMLQWKNPRDIWLLKDPAHQSFLPTLFDVFPNARVIMTHRDPLRAQGSTANLLGTCYWTRSDKPFDATAFDELLTPEGTAARLDQTIDWIETGAVPADQITHSRYADLVSDPLATLQQLYQSLDLPFTDQAREGAAAYLGEKPKGKFGTHHYTVEQQDETRALFTRYQHYFDVPSED